MLYPALLAVTSELYLLALFSAILALSLYSGWAQKYAGGGEKLAGSWRPRGTHTGKANGPGNGLVFESWALQGHLAWCPVATP